MFANNADVAYTTDLQLRITSWNHSAEKTYGRKEKDVLGKSVIEITGSKFDPEMREKLTRELLEKGSVRTQIEHISGSGSKIVFDSITLVNYDPNGNLIGFMSVNRDITELKQAEEELHKSQETYKELVSNARSIIIKQDTAGRITFFNEFAQDFFGYTEKEIIGRTAGETIVPQKESSGRDLYKMIERIYGDPDKYSKNINENIKKNGERVWVEWYNKALYDKNGNRTGHIAVGVDITGRIKSEESLKESEERFKAMAEASPVGMGVVSIPEGKYLYVNPAYEQNFGYDRDELLNNNSLNIFWDKNDRELLLKKLQEDNYVSNFEVRLKRKDGSSFWCMSFVQKISFVNRPAYLGTFIDITRRKEAEEKLEEARGKLNIALENGKIGVWEWNMETDEVVWDERMEIMFGLKPGSFGRTFKAFENLVNEEDLSHIQKAINKALKLDLPYETVFRTKPRKGKTKYISTKALVYKDKHGKPVSFTGVCFDVTGLREGTEKLILKLNEELLRSNTELENFAYVASHDLQEPLRMISSFTQLLSQQYKDKLDDKAQEYIHFAVDGSKRMYDLLNGLLAYSRINSKRKEFNRIELNRVLESATKNLSLKIEERNAVIKSDELPAVIADENQMIQLFQNLIANSIKFSTESPSVYISSESDNDHYLISIKDEGMGIEPQYFDRIFQMFQRLHPKEQFEGTGIGLAVCKRIVERHGGSIWVESEYGKGSTFFFTIPKNDQV